jgi:hypothetical protein
MWDLTGAGLASGGRAKLVLDKLCSDSTARAAKSLSKEQRGKNFLIPRPVLANRETDCYNPC